MKSFIAAATILGLVALVRADPDPKTPPQTNIGSPLQISWDADPTRAWTSCTISLMSGSNFDMVKVVDITTNQDCTTTPGQLSWPVPQVSPASLIYFLQFTNNANASDAPVWTTRFAIANNGQTTTPANPNQPGGAAIPWGVGSLGANGGGGGGGGAGSSVSSSSPIGGSSTSSGPASSSTSSNPLPVSSTSTPIGSSSSTPAPRSSASSLSPSRASNLASASSSKTGDAATRTGSAAAGMGVALVAALAGYALA